MKKIEPKKLNKKPVDWEISERVRNVIKNFAQYSERSEEAIVGKLIITLLDDEDFINWAKTRKNNVRLLRELGLDDDSKNTSN